MEYISVLVSQEGVGTIKGEQYGKFPCTMSCRHFGGEGGVNAYLLMFNVGVSGGG
jgi:hypothetical protein